MDRAALAQDRARLPGFGAGLRPTLKDQSGHDARALAILLEYEAGMPVAVLTEKYECAQSKRWANVGSFGDTGDSDTNRPILALGVSPTPVPRLFGDD